MAGLRAAVLCAVVAVLLAPRGPAQAQLRINDLEVFLNDHEVSVSAVALGVIPPALHEPLQTGLPAHVRFRIELWRHTPYWRDQLLTTRVVERHLTYNVLTKEYRVTFVKGESRSVYTARELRDAQRVISEVRGLKLSPASALDPQDVIYVRVHAEVALNGENTFLTRMAGTAAQTMRQSDYRTISRVQ